MAKPRAPHAPAATKNTKKTSKKTARRPTATPSAQAVHTTASGGRGPDASRAASAGGQKPDAARAASGGRAPGAARHHPKTALVKAPGADGAPLTGTEKRRLAEAVRLGEEARSEAEGALVGYGRWLLVNVFDDDTTEALLHKRTNPVWHALLELADGPRLRLSRTSIHLAVQIAAYDKRLNDEAFRALDVTRKRMLLPLADDRRIRDAAQHVSGMKLTASDTQAYVRAQLAESGEKPALRMTAKTATARVSRAAKPFRDRAMLGKWRAQLGELTGAPRQEALNDLRAIARAVTDLMAALQK